MRRRAFLSTAGLAGLAGLAGCAASGDGGTATPPPGGTGRPETGTPAPGERPDATPPDGGDVDLPDGVYVQRFREGLAMQGTAESGPYAAGLMYAAPHVFWTVSGTDRRRIERAGDLHLMATVWDPETGTVLPEAGVSVEITRDGALVSQEVIYPMLSQPMGFHYGANFGLDGDGTYTVELSVGAMSTRRTGPFQGRFSEASSVEMPFEYSRQERDDIRIRRLGDETATPGAVDPMEMEMLPASLAPPESDLPGTVVGTGTSNDARFVVSVLDTPPAGIDGDGQYIAVSARTRYNRSILPAMGLEGVLSRGGEPVYEGAFTPTLDPDLDYHYGAVVDGVESGDELPLRVAVQPQTARHEGYETAFGGLDGRMPDVTITV